MFVEAKTCQHNDFLETMGCSTVACNPISPVKAFGIYEEGVTRCCGWIEGRCRKHQYIETNPAHGAEALFDERDCNTFSR